VGVVTLSVALRIADIGRNVYALGGNPVAAGLAGIPITRYKIAIYAVTSLTAGVGGSTCGPSTSKSRPASCSSLP
jgi:ribose transport system permease protein